jgi:hypothetical protein
MISQKKLAAEMRQLAPDHPDLAEWLEGEPLPQDKLQAVRESVNALRLIDELEREYGGPVPL